MRTSIILYLEKAVRAMNHYRKLEEEEQENRNQHQENETEENNNKKGNVQLTAK